LSGRRRSRSAAAAELGAALKGCDPLGRDADVLAALVSGEAVAPATLSMVIGDALVDDLVTTGVLTPGPGSVRLERALGFAHGLIYVRPDGAGADDAEVVYLGPDSAFLTEAVVRVAPSGRRAADLGAGTGLHAAVLSRCYDVVVATELLSRAARTARLTLELNGIDSSGVVVADVGTALRPRSFDLVTANPPWVPRAATEEAPVRVFADGGCTGTELPALFMRQAAGLLAPDGVAVVLALDVTCDDGRRPLRAACEELGGSDFVTWVVRTRLAATVPFLEAKMRERQPLIVAANHVAVIIGAPSAADPGRVQLSKAVHALAGAWGTEAQQVYVRRPRATGTGVPAVVGTPPSARSTKSRTRSS